MGTNRKPRAYLDSVPDEGTAPGIVYVPFHNTDIGARKSGMPNAASTGPGSISHVGGGTSRGK